MKEIQIDDENYPCWACQLIGYTDTWSHARRKRRLAMREEAMKKQCVENPESGSQDEKLLHQLAPAAENEVIISENAKPLLVCTLIVDEKNINNEESSEDIDADSNKEELIDKKILRICMLFESGSGGKLSLETLRQYLVNKLNIREFFHKQQPSKPNKKKRKRKKMKKMNNQKTVNVKYMFEKN